MKNHIIKLLLFLTVGVSQQNWNVEFMKKYGGLTYSPNSNKPYTGKVFDLYKSNGNKKVEGYYKDGLRNRQWEWWSEDGKMESSGTYKDGKRDGLNTTWYENGQKEEEVTYKDGELDGLGTAWYENGEKWKEGPYKDGKSDGLWTYWDNDGSKYEGKVIRKDDEDGTFLYWYDNEKTKIESHKSYKDGELDGLYTRWYENGQKWKEGPYKDGKQHGLWTSWHENGQKKSEGTYKDGKEEKWTEWHRNGQKSREGTYKDGIEVGKWIHWNEDGRKMIEGTYKGLWTYWYENGQKKSEGTFKDGSKVGGMDFIFVEGGTFQMGSDDGMDDEKPVHPVSLSDFYISKTEVTYNQYKIFSEATGRDNWDVSFNTNYDCNKGDYPQVGLLKDDAIAFCDWLGRLIGKTVRLPTEAEWEYAARGGNKGKDYIYSGSNNIDEVAWYWINSGDEYLNGDYVNITTYYNKYNPNQDCRLHPVAQKKPNELGLYDMSGNALEWCSDYYNPTFYSHLSDRDPLNDSGVNVYEMGWMTVMRGGAWNSSENECRNTSRALFVPFSHASGIDGFRPVMEK